MKSSYTKILLGAFFAIGGISQKENFTAAIGISLLMNGILEMI